MMPAPASDGPIVDAHVHFWDPATLCYPWLDDIPALDRRFLADDYDAAVGDLPVERCVVVEGNCRPDQAVSEVGLLTELGASDPRIGGVVAFADLTRPSTLERTLECLAPCALVKGIRQNIQGQPRGFALQRTFVEGVRSVGRLGMTFDLCATHDQLDEAISLVEQCADTQFVLDHCGKPAIRSGSPERWQRDIRRLAGRENVCCKLSGLLTEADATRWSEGDLLPYAEHVADCFGIDRLLYGSDWPVMTLAGEYRSWFAFTARVAASWSGDERRRFYAGNAARVYRL